MQLPNPVIHRWTREEFEGVVRRGGFDAGLRVELIEGELVDMTPHDPEHITALELVAAALRNTYKNGWIVRTQAPIALSDASEPEPDLAVVKGEYRDYLEEHPRHAHLLVEVSRTSLAHDRGNKLRIYAEAEMPEYWILNLVDRQLEVFRAPEGDSYSERITFGPGDAVPLPGFPDTALRIADVLP